MANRSLRPEPDRLKVTTPSLVESEKSFKQNQRSTLSRLEIHFHSSTASKKESKPPINRNTLLETWDISKKSSTPLSPVAKVSGTCSYATHIPRTRHDSMIIYIPPALGFGRIYYGISEHLSLFGNIREPRSVFLPTVWQSTRRSMHEAQYVSVRFCE